MFCVFLRRNEYTVGTYLEQEKSPRASGESSGSHFNFRQDCGLYPVGRVALQFGSRRRRRRQKELFLFLGKQQYLFVPFKEATSSKSGLVSKRASTAVRSIPPPSLSLSPATGVPKRGLFVENFFFLFCSSRPTPALATAARYENFPPAV